MTQQTDAPVESTPLDTTPRPPAGPTLGPLGWARWAWRQLTSMRTALFLLFLLAAPAITGQMIALDGGRHIEWPARSGPTPAK